MKRVERIIINNMKPIIDSRSARSAHITYYKYELLLRSLWTWGLNTDVGMSLPLSWDGGANPNQKSHLRSDWKSSACDQSSATRDYTNAGVSAAGPTYPNTPS